MVNFVNKGSIKKCKARQGLVYIKYIIGDDILHVVACFENSNKYKIKS